MLSFTLSLDRFSQSVPVCQLTANLEELLSLLQSSQHEMIVVVTQLGEPLGVVTSQQLLSHVLPHRRSRGKRSSPPLQLESLMQPLATLLVSMEIKELESRLQKESHPFYALIDNEGKFLGLLNSWSLLKSLLSSYSLNSSENRDFFLNSFAQELLDKLPVPIVLYSAQGQVIYQNQHWQEQIDEPVALINTLVFSQLLTNEWLFNQKTGQILPVSSAINHLEDISNTYSPQRLTKVNQQPEEIFPLAIKSSKTGVEKTWQLLSVPFFLSDTDRAFFSEPMFHWLVLAMDTTQQQQCSQELAVKNADLTHLNRLKDEFLACISHEFKSPLTAVVGLASLLKEQKIGELNERQVRYAELIYRSGRQLMTLVNDLLDLTRLETGQLPLNPSTVSIAGVCQQAYYIIQEKYSVKIDSEIAFSLEIEPGLEQLVADEQRLQQMLVHLLDNAFKFTQNGGKVGIQVNRWENLLAFTVWDTGIGIPEESQHLIFEKFQQLENPLTRQFEGAGLGLVLTQRLAKAHGGDISFLSQVGIGSQFTLLLPCDPLTESLDGNQSHPLILAVEALPQAIHHLSEQLVDLGYRVIIARTGTEAVTKARQLQPKRIFLNPTLPLLSGWDVLTLLKSDPQTQNIPVIITAVAEVQHLSQQKGADGFLALPATRQALERVLTDTTAQGNNEQKALTILQLYGTESLFSESKLLLDSQLRLTWAKKLPELNYRLLEADSLDQAEIIASVWGVNVLIIDETVAEDLNAYLRSLKNCDSLATLPLVTLDTKVTEAANQIKGLSVFPCLLPDTENSLEQLLQVIQIATETRG